MTQVALNRLLSFPDNPIAGTLGSSSGVVTSAALNATNDKIAQTFYSPATDSITKVYVRTATVTTGCTVEGRIETTGADTFPTGTLVGTTTNGTVAIADTDDNVWKTITLTSAASLTKDTLYALVLQYSSGAVPNLNFSYQTILSANHSMGIRTALADAGGAYANLGTSVSALLAVIEFSSGGVLPVYGFVPYDGSPVQTAFNSGSSPDEWAMRFKSPFPCTIAGARVAMSNVAAGGDFKVSLWDASGTTDAQALAQSATIDGDSMLSTTADGLVAVMFATPYQIAANTEYFLGVRAETANNIAVWSQAVVSSVTNAMRCTPGGVEFYKATRTWTAGTAGAWTTDTNNMIPFSLLVSKLGDDAGGAGSIGDFGIPG